MAEGLYLKDVAKLTEHTQEAFNDQIIQMRRSIERMDEAKQKFRKTGVIDDCVRPEIAASWKRCRDRGLDGFVPFPPSVDKETLLRRQKKEAYLIHAAKPVMEDILEQISRVSLIGIVYLCDRDNVILSKVEPPVLREVSTQAGLTEGSIWTEENIGTNSITLSLDADDVFCTYGSEHYFDAFSWASCVSAPLHNNDGELVGSVTITYYREFYNGILLALIKTAARLIEKELWSFRYNAVMDYILNNADEGVLLLNSRLEIIQINRALQRMLGDVHITPSQLDIRMVFKEIDFAELADSARMHNEIRETFLSYHKINMRVNVDIYRIEAYGTADGYVIICRDIGKLISDVRRFTSPSAHFSFDDIITQNGQMREIIRQCRDIAKNDCPVLLLGESGTGKEIFAQSIHNASSRASKPFVAVNCAALPISLVESELFGYEKGAFTDGLATGKAGKFEIANGGTIFLDEIGELPLDVQAKLLRVLDNHTIMRIGGNTEKKLDIRVIAATNRNLYQCVIQRSFREDLYFRINMFTVELPPLSQRKEDVPLLAEYFLKNLSAENRDVNKSFSAEYIKALNEHDWRGNVRELQNVVGRGYYLAPGTTIGTAQLPPGFLEEHKNFEAPSSVTMESMERELVKRALKACNGNVSKAADSIHLSRSTFYRKMKAYGITEV